MKVAANSKQVVSRVENDRYEAVFASIGSLPACVHCHNKHEKRLDRGKMFLLNDVLGGWVVSIGLQSIRERP